MSFEKPSDGNNPSLFYRTITTLTAITLIAAVSYLTPDSNTNKNKQQKADTKYIENTHKTNDSIPTVNWPNQ